MGLAKESKASRASNAPLSSRPAGKADWTSAAASAPSWKPKPHSRAQARPSSPRRKRLPRWSRKWTTSQSSFGQASKTEIKQAVITVMPKNAEQVKRNLTDSKRDMMNWRNKKTAISLNTAPLKPSRRWTTSQSSFGQASKTEIKLAVITVRPKNAAQAKRNLTDSKRDMMNWKNKKTTISLNTVPPKPIWTLSATSRPNRRS